jgi:hypothetical protein
MAIMAMATAAVVTRAVCAVIVMVFCWSGVNPKREGVEAEGTTKLAARRELS